MADSEDMRLQRMGLVQLPNTHKTDEAVGKDDFITRLDLYNKLKDPTSGILNDKKAFVGNKSAYETSEYESNRQYIPCFLPVPILKIEGWLPNKLSTGPSDKKQVVENLLLGQWKKLLSGAKSTPHLTQLKGET